MAARTAATELIDRLRPAVDDHVRGVGRLVRIGDTGEVIDLAGQRFLVQTLDVALGEHVDRAAHVDLDKATDPPAHFSPRVRVRRDRCGDGDDAVAGQQLGNEPDATDVDVAVFLAEAEAGTQCLTDFVAVEHLDIQAALAQLGCDALSDRRFAGAGKAGEPDRETAHQATGSATA